MSSEAVTQNDLREILSRTVGSIPSEYKKLLWTNTSPTGTFGAQTISLDLSNYDAVCVEFKAYPDLWILLTVTADINFSGMCDMGRNDTFYTQNRAFAVTSSGITFEDCKLGTSASVYNNHNVPYKIYGIKYERVAPPQVDASDYVVEQGTEGIWTYRKWDSGIAECWGTWSGSLTHYGTSFGGYAFYTTVSFPTGLFTDMPIVTYSGTVDSSFALTGTILTGTKDSVNCYAISGSGNTQPVNFYLICKGRWK